METCERRGWHCAKTRGSAIMIFCGNGRRFEQMWTILRKLCDYGKGHDTLTSSSSPPSPSTSSVPSPLPTIATVILNPAVSHDSPPNASPATHNHVVSQNNKLARLAAQPLPPLTLKDLVRHSYSPPSTPSRSWPPPATHARSFPFRLRRRILALRNLPFIIVSNLHISEIYNSYVYSLRTVLSVPPNTPGTLTEEERSTELLQEIVITHANTIATLAKGFIGCKMAILTLYTGAATFGGVKSALKTLFPSGRPPGGLYSRRLFAFLIINYLQVRRPPSAELDPYLENLLLEPPTTGRHSDTLSPSSLYIYSNWGGRPSAGISCSVPKLCTPATSP